MNNSTAPYSDLIAVDMYYFFWSSQIYLYGYLVVSCLALFGNAFQIMTFSRKALLRISTGVFFLALSISDMIHVLINLYVPIVYGFHQSDRSDQFFTCRLRHFSSYFTSNFSAWVLTASRIIDRKG